MSGALTFRTATRGDVVPVVALLNATFRTPLDAATWEWYLYGNPFGETRVYLADDGNGPAGVFAYTPVPLWLRGRMVPASSGHHLCLNPAQQGGAAFIGLSRHALKSEAELGMRLSLGLPNRRSYLPQKALLKWSDFCLLDCLCLECPLECDHGCEVNNRFGSDFDRFYLRLRQSLGFCIEKNAAWMSWRFHQRPGQPYTVYTTASGGELTGYVALKRWRDSSGYSKAHIVDLHAVNEDALSHLLAAAQSYAAGSDELNIWAAPGYPYRGHLESLGFAARVTAGQPLIARALDGAALALADASCSFSYADGDFVY